MPPSEYAVHWDLAADVTFLNHGSFGACPREVLEFQQQLRQRMERQPVQFFVRDLEVLLDEARGALANFLVARADDLAFVPNATHGVNTVLLSFPLEPGDELLTTDHAYNACRNALEHAAARAQAKVVVAHVPFPLSSPAQVTQSMLEHVTDRTRLALIDHVTSPTGLIFPIEALVPLLAERGIDTLVDGAHAPGMIAVNLERLGAAFYTGNCHKWLCSPKGAAFLYVRKDRQGRIRPLSISHGANSSRTDRSRFRLEFDWAGTDDPTAFLSVPAALRFMEKLLLGGWSTVREKNHQLALTAREILCQSLKIGPPSPAEMIGSLVAVPLPEAKSQPSPSPRSLLANPLYEALHTQFGLEVVVSLWPRPSNRVLRVSCQLYNSVDQYGMAADAVAQLLQAES